MWVGVGKGWVVDPVVFGSALGWVRVDLGLVQGGS